MMRFLHTLCLGIVALALPLAAAAEPEAPATRGLSRQYAAVMPSEQGVYDKVYLLVVGIGAYPTDARVRPLDHAIPDATAFRDVLTEQVAIDGVVQRLDAEATRQGIFDALSELREVITERDALIVFWAGHGISERPADGVPLDYFVTWDGSGSVNDGQNIAMAELRDQLASLPATHKLLIVDACFAGVLARRGTPPLLTRTRPPPSTWTRRDVFAVMTAGAEGQPVLDGGGDGHSAFTGALLDRLRDIDGYLTASELHLHVREQVASRALQAGLEQTPMYALVDEAPDQAALPGDFVLIASEAVRLRRARERALAAVESHQATCEPADHAAIQDAIRQVDASDLPPTEQVWLLEGAARAAERLCD